MDAMMEVQPAAPRRPRKAVKPPMRQAAPKVKRTLGPWGSRRRYWES
jgi:hypothetical protein